jgi:uncharacterized repeat protein (TIGR04076 family)
MKSAMKRRNFLPVSGCCAAALAAAQPPDPTKPMPAPRRQRYYFEIEVVAPAKSLCAAHRTGDKFVYPADLGKICPWLRDSMSGALRAMEWGATFSWDYAGTPFAKVSDPNGVSTEFIRCPDPTDHGIVVKITRTALKS